MNNQTENPTYMLDSRYGPTQEQQQSYATEARYQGVSNVEIRIAITQATDNPKERKG